MIIYFCLLFFLYTILVVLFIYGWSHLPEVPAKESSSPLFISVIIPVRNEAEYISELLQDLEKQEYPSHLFEVLVIDDHSKDATAHIVKDRIEQSVINIKYHKLGVPEDYSWSTKKQAITEGVHKAKGEIIMTTDGDCRVGTKWIASIIRYFQELKANFLAGPVTFFQEKNVFEKLQTIEFASLIASGAASIYFGKPNMCNGANLAFRKDIFIKVGGYRDHEHVISGDDEFLMQKFFQYEPVKIHFLKSQDALVYTHPKKSIKEFILQRKRWAGKWKHHKNLSIKLIAIFIFMVHFSFLLSVLMVFFYIKLLPVVLTFAGAKIILEWTLLNKVFNFFHKKLNTSGFVFLQFIYPFYAVFFGLLSNFGSYTWKERTYKN